MYSRYSSDYEQAQAALSEWMKKSPELVKIVKMVESNRLCCGLTIPTYMLSPIQRVPRYRLLLEAYLKTLKHDDVDYENTKKALELIGEAAFHMEDRMFKLANFQQLVKIQRSLTGNGAESVVQPGREFLLKAPAKQAKQRGGTKRRVLFLFSDILVITYPEKRFGGTYKITNILQLREVKVGTLDAKTLADTQTFSINLPNRTFWFSMQTELEKSQWQKKIEEASSTEVAKRNTFLAEYSRLSSTHLSALLNDPGIQLELKRFAGQEPPQEHNLPSIQQRIRARLSSVTGTSYSPSAIRHARPSGERKVVELISKPTHLSETGHLDPTTLGKSRSLSREETDGGEDEPDGGAPGEGVDDVDFVETLLSPISTYVWVRRFSPDPSPWKQIWCQLCGLWIYCFDDHQVGRQPFGCIALGGYSLGEAEAAFSFSLTHPVKSAYHLKFDSQYECDRWSSIINRDLHKFLLEEILNVQL